MGLAVLPARLKNEMKILAEKIVANEDLYSNEATEKHAKWAYDFLKKYDKVDASNIDEIIQQEVGLVFEQVLLDAGVYKTDEKGREAFMKFVNSCK